MKDLLFNDELFGDLTVFDDYENGQLWFVGIEVAKKLGYKNPKSAVYKLVPKEHKRQYTISVSHMDTEVSQGHRVQLIDEAGFYRLVFKSTLDIADEFTEWVCGEVIPNVRKYGMYIKEDLLKDNKRLREQLQKYRLDSAKKTIELAELRAEIQATALYGDDDICTDEEIEKGYEQTKSIKKNVNLL